MHGATSGEQTRHHTTGLLRSDKIKRGDLVEKISITVLFLKGPKENIDGIHAQLLGCSQKHAQVCPTLEK